MVSQISSRLLGGRNTPSSAGNSDGGNASSVGGYSADREGNTSSRQHLPGHIDLQLKHKRHSTSDCAGRSKRKKLNEEHFAASVAKDDITRAGLAVPVLRAASRGPRAISLGKVDATTVKLVFSHEVAASPFLFPASIFPTDFGSLYDSYTQMFDSCRNAYTEVDPEVSDSLDSLSDTQSDTSTSSEKFPLNPRIDDSLALNESPLLKRPNHTAKTVSCSSAVSMTMEEALTVCNSSRLLALSTPPYLVVHSNSAFEQLTGRHSSKILGKPLYSLIKEDGTSDHPSLASCVASSAEGRDISVSIVGKQNITCQTKLTPVVSVIHCGQVKPDRVVTHYAMELFSVEEEPTSVPRNQQVVSQGSLPNNPGLHSTVVG